MKSKLIKGVTLTIFVCLLTLVVLQQGNFFKNETQTPQEADLQIKNSDLRYTRKLPNQKEIILDQPIEESVNPKENKGLSFSNYVAQKPVDSAVPIPMDSIAKLKKVIDQFKEIDEEEMTRMMSSKTMIMSVDAIQIFEFFTPLTDPQEIKKLKDSTKKNK